MVEEPINNEVVEADDFMEQPDAFPKQSEMIPRGESEAMSSELTGLALSADGTEWTTEDYHTSKSQFMETGESELMNKTLERVSSFENEWKTQVVSDLLLAQDLADDTKTAILNNYVTDSQSSLHFPNLRNQQTEFFASGSGDEMALAALDEIMKIEDDAGAASRQLRELQLQWDKDNDGWDILADVGGMMVPWNESLTLRGAMSEAFGDVADMGDYTDAMLFGQGGIDRMIKLFESVPVSEWGERMRNFTKGLKEHSGYFAANQLIEMSIATELLDRLEGTTETTKANALEIMDKVVGVLDTLAVGSVMKATTRGIGAYMRGTTASRLASTDPEKAAKAAAAGIADPEVAIAAGSNQIDMAARNLLPKWGDDVAEHVEDGTLEALQADRAFAQETLGQEVRRMDEVHALDDTDLPTIAGNLQKDLDARAGIKHSGQNATVRVNDDGTIDMSFAYVKGENQLFDSAEEAVDAVKSIYPDADVSVIKVNRGTREATLDTEATARLNKADRKVKKQEKILSGLDPKDPKRAEVEARLDRATAARDDIGQTPVIQYRADVNVKHIPSERDKLLFVDGDISGWNHAADFIGGYLGNISRRMTAWAERGFDHGARLEHRLEMVTKPYLKLKEKRKVTEVLIRGDEQGVEYTVAQLKAEGLSPDEIRGYYSYRNAQDIRWHIKDKQLSDELRADGFSWISGAGRDYVGKTVGVDGQTTLMNKGASVLDPSTGMGVKVTDRLLQEVASGDATIVRLKNSEGIGTDVWNHMIVRKKDGMTMGSVPLRGVLNKRQGYINRAYDDQYFITMTRPVNTDGISGATKETVLALEGNIKDAERAVARFQAKYPDATITPRHDKSMDMSDKMRYENMVSESRRDARFMGRGDHLKTSDGIASRIKNPVEALLGGIRQTARSVGEQRVIDNFKQRWINTYPNLVPKSPDGIPMFPRSIDDFAGGMVTSKQTKQARRMWRYINMIEGNMSTSTKRTREVMIGLGESIGRLGLEKTGKAISRSKDPMAGLRMLGFYGMIVGNPLRQFMLNAKQFTFLAGLNPKQFAQALPRSGFLGAALAAPGPAAYKAVGKAFGVTTKEAEDLVKAFRESGFIEAPNTNSIARDGLKVVANELERETKIGRAVGKVADMGKGGLDKIRRYGFGAGEQINLGATWIMAYQRVKDKWAKAGKSFNISDLKAQEAISSEARGMAFSMNRAGDMPYQHGLLSLPTQFLAVQQKAWLMVTSSKQFTAKEKVGMAMGQFALWGGQAWGIKSFVENFFTENNIELSPVAKNIVTNGIMDTAYDSALSALTGDDVNINMAESFAPGGGFPKWFAENWDVFTGESFRDAWSLGGPSVAMLGRWGDAIDAINMALADPELDALDVTSESLVQAASLFSGASNFMKIRMWEQMQHITNKKGEPILEATAGEIWAQGLFGIQSEAMHDYYQIMKEGPKSKRYNDSVKNYADMIYNHMVKEVMPRVNATVMDPSDPSRSLAEQAGGMQRELLKSHGRMVQMAKALLPPEERYAVIQELERKIMAEYKGGKKDNLVQQIIDNALKGSSGVPMEDTIRMLENADFKVDPKAIELLRRSQDAMKQLIERQ